MQKFPVVVEIPVEALVALDESPENIQKKINIWVAIGLFSLNKLTLEKSAALANMHIYDFEVLLSENNISISRLNKDDLDIEMKVLDKI